EQTTLSNNRTPAGKKLRILASGMIIFVAIAFILLDFFQGISSDLGKSAFELFEFADTDAAVYLSLATAAYVGAAGFIICAFSYRLGFYVMSCVFAFSVVVTLYYGLIVPFGFRGELWKMLYVIIPSGGWLLWLARKGAYAAPIEKRVAVMVSVIGALFVLVAII